MKTKRVWLATELSSFGGGDDRDMRKYLMPLALCAATGVGCSRTRDSATHRDDYPQADSPKAVRPLADPRVRKAHPSWTRVNAADGNFRALFPVEPKRSKSADFLAFEYTAVRPDGAVAFFITFTPNIDTSVSLDARLTGTQDSRKSRSAQRRSIDICGYAGREMTHEYTDANRPVVSRHRIFYAGRDMYHLLVLAIHHETFPEEDANLFFSGFELLKESEEKGAPP
jgi:hypothetical protein